MSDTLASALPQTDSPPPPGGVRFSDEIEIRADKPLPGLDIGPVRAFAAVGTGKLGGPKVALICAPHMTPRSDAANIFAVFSHPALVRLVTCGPVFWPLEKAERFVLIYENGFGKPLASPTGNPMAFGLRQEDVLEFVVRPIVGVLTEFRNKDFIHGGIRVSNLFDGGGRGLERLVLGDALSGPPSAMQPALYEPVERAMADPMARGLGTQADDLYALGVVLAVLLRHNDPLEGMEPRQVIFEKIENGSYSALTGKDRFTGAILELLRGLLYDDPAQRWALEDVQAWLDGQRLSPKQSLRKLKAPRSITFAGQKYFRAQVLAMDLHTNLPETADLIESGTLEQWIARSLEDKPGLQRLETALTSLEDFGRGPGHWDRLACRLSIALDPVAPIRYKGVSVKAEGLGAALASAIVQKKDLTPYAEIIAQNTVLFWLDMQASANLDVGTLISRYDSCRAFLRQKNMGYGIERCAYILNPEAPCLSERFRDYYVRSPEGMMSAFEKIIEKKPDTAPFFDRHIAAFLSVKERKAIDPYLPEIGASERSKQVLGTLKVLASIQKRARLPSFPHLSRCIAGLMDPVYQLYHDRDLRKTIREKVEKARDSGDLGKMASHVENAETLQKDYVAFRKAMREYASLRKDRQRLEAQTTTATSFGRSTGRQVAALVSSLIAAMVILTVAFIHFSGGKVF